MSRKIERFAEELIAKFNNVSLGHCLRVDDLPINDCCDLCFALADVSSFSFYILSEQIQRDEYSNIDPSKIIKIDQAIEKRNLCEESLCLIIPTGTTSSAISSLGNTFERFETAFFLEKLEKEFLKEIPDSLKQSIKKILKQAKYRRRIQTEDIVEYLNLILDNPTIENVGTSIWRLNLIPDKSPKFINRLKLNYDCTQALANPIRPQATIRQRLESTKLRKNHFMDQLEHFLIETTLKPPAKKWLKCFADDQGYDFSCWEFPEIEQSDLEEIRLKKPKRADNTGILVPKCGNLECNSPEEPIIGKCGEKNKIMISWETVPKKTKDVAYWQVELIPSREDYDNDDVDTGSLPAPIRRKNSQKTAKISLDIDPDGLEFQWVQVRVVGLDENEDEIGQENEVIEALSERICLEIDSDTLTESESKNKLYTYPNLPYGFLDLSLKYSSEEWITVPQNWKIGEIDYFNVMVGDSQSQICRIGISHILKEVQMRSLSAPEDFGHYKYKIDDFDKFDIERVKTRGFSLDLEKFRIVQESLQTFKDQREKLFKHIREQYKGNGLVENADWDALAYNTTLYNRAKMYADAYAELLDKARNDSQNDPDIKELIQFLLSIDSMELKVYYTTGNQKALLLLPTHPYRILWFGAYTSLLKNWRERVLELPKKQRQTSINMQHLKEIAPTNIPFIIPNTNEPENWYIFSRNIGFFTALFLSPSSSDWSRITSDLQNFLGYEDEISPTDVKPKKISEDVKKYLSVHPYSKNNLKIGIVNAGNGRLLEAALSSLITPPEKSKSNENIEFSFEDYPIFKRLDVSVIAKPPLPLEIEGLKNLRSKFYDSDNLASDASALYPAYTQSLTERTESPDFPNSNQHLSFYFDAANPKVALERFFEESSESISFYGLINRWLSDSSSEYGLLKWRYWLATSKPEKFERHPADPKFTDGLLKLSKVISQSLAFSLDSSASDNDSCCLVTVLGPDERAFINRLHQRSDWVLTIDRFFGTDFFDSPHDPYLSDYYKKYVIDYSPDFTEGLGDRLLVTTCWQDELTNVILSKLKDIGLSADEEYALGLIESLKSLSGNYALELFENSGDSEYSRKNLAIAISIKYLIDNLDTNGGFLIPIRIHPELFDSTESLSDFLFVTFIKDNIKIQCVDCIITRENEFEEHGKQNDRIENTEFLIANEYFPESSDNKIAVQLERARLMMLMRYYFSKSLRYHFIKESDNISKFNDILSRVEAKKVSPVINKRAFLVVFDENIEKTTLDRTFLDKLFFETTVTLNNHKIASDHFIDDKLDSTYESSKIKNNDIGNDDIEVKKQFASNEINKNSGSVVSTYNQSENSEDISYPEKPQIVLGSANHQDVLWQPSTKGSPHLVIIGIPGQGKSVTINTLLIQLQKNGVGTLTFDFHSQFSQADNSFAKICQPEIWDSSQGLPFSPFESNLDIDIGQNSWKIEAFALADIFAYVATLGDQQKDSVYQAIESCYEDIRNNNTCLFPTITDLKKKLERLEQQKKIQKGALARLRPLLEMDVFKPVSELWNISKSTKKGLVIDLKGIGSETVQLATSAFVLRKVYKDILKWEESKVMKLAIVLDEAHKMAKDTTLPLIMQEARKFGVAVIVASQNINHFHDNVIGNVGTQIVFRTNDPDSKKVSKFVNMQGNINSKHLIENLTTGIALVKTPEMQFAKKVNMKKID
ncbi:MAG: ATP-binding protein [Desulfamplus sp.]|nr:ATP-binding protein [Desulfamplus sp.]